MEVNRALAGSDPEAKARRPPRPGWWRCWISYYCGKNVELAARLEACAENLVARTVETEPDFVALGGDLQKLYEAASELAQVIDQTTARLHTILTGNRFGGTDGLVSATLRSVHTGVAGVDGEMEVLTTMMTGLAAMDPQLARIKRICLFLQSTAVGFAVESSRTVECQQAFGSFVDEIRGLSGRIATVEGKVSQELSRARSEETTRVQELQSGLAAMRELARQLETTSGRAAAEVQGGLDRIVALMNATRERSATLREHAEGAVYHVQFGDITRQKNEHIVVALNEAATALRRAKGRTAVRLAAGAADHALAIQIGQLNVVCRELEAAEQQLSQAFARIAGTVEEFIAPLREHGAADAAGKADRQRMLESDFDQFLDLDGKGRALRTHAAETVDHAFAAAERLAAQMEEVQSINRDMHLLALNATVKTAALGSSGVTLEILSMQIHELYREADSAVSEVVTQAAQLRNRDPQAAPPTDGQASDATGTKQRLEEGVRLVRQTFEDFEQMTANALERAGAQRQQLAAATSKLGALRGLAAQLRELAGELGEVRLALAPMCHAAKPGEALSDADIETRYTMQAERDVHRQIAAERAHGAVTARTPTAAPVADVAKNTTPAAALPAGVPARDQAASPTPPALTEGVPAGQSLGDNVELF